MVTQKKPLSTSAPIAGRPTLKTALKAPVKKIASKKKPVKYEDKSVGQPEVIPIFNAIKNLLKPHLKGSMKVNEERGGLYVLVSDKPVEIEGRKKDELYFAGIMIQKGYVGFYFMPVYGYKEPEKVFNPELLKALKGKGCFHIKKNDLQTLDNIREALKSGYNIYKQQGWVE